MTIAIGINLGLCAILAADTRTTYNRFGHVFYDDNSEKVQKTKMGLITGAGFGPLLDGVKNRLAIEEFTNTECMLNIIKHETEKTKSAWRRYPQIESWIGQTGWIFSYITEQSNETILRVGIFHPSLNKEMYLTYEVGKPEIIFPVELATKTVEAIYDSILQLIKVPIDSSEIQASIQQNINIIAILIKELQPQCASISKRFQVGIHSGGQMGISNLIDIQDDETFSVNITLNDLSAN